MSISRATLRALLPCIAVLVLGCPVAQREKRQPIAKIFLSQEEVEPGKSVHLSLRLNAPSAALPAVSWSAGSGSILQGLVANEADFTAPNQEGSYEIKAMAMVGDSLYEAQSTIKVRLVRADGAQTGNEYVEPGRLRNLSSVNALMFADYSPLYLSQAEPGIGGSVLFKLRLPAGIPGQAIFNCQSTGAAPRSALMAKQRSDAAFDYYQAEARPSAFPFTYWFEWRDDFDALYLSESGVSPSPPAESARFRLDSGSSSPSWAKGAFLYRIVPDRFLNGDYSNDPDGTKADWNSEIKPQDAARALGGDLEGMGRKLEYLRTLGADAILVDPLFGPDYAVERRYSLKGASAADSDQKLSDYLSRARARGLKVILDASVPGAAQGNGDALAAPGGALAAFVGTWCKRSMGSGFKAPSGGGMDASAQYAALRERMKSINAEAIVLSPSRGLASPSWDILDDPDSFMSPLSVFLTGSDPLSPDSRSASPGDGSRFLRAIADAASGQRGALGNALALDEPGVARLATRIRAAEERRKPAGDAAVPESRWASLYRLAGILQMTLPGSPLLLYGDEAALEGASGEDSLRGYPWGRENKGMISLYKDLSSLRKSYPALKAGSFRPLASNASGLASYIRWDQKSRLIVAVNAGTETQELRIDAALAGLQSGDRLKSVLASSESGYQSAGTAYAVKDSKLSIALLPRTGLVLLCPVPRELPPSAEKRPRLKTVFPADKAKDLSSDTRVIMEFSEEIEQGSISEAFRIEPETPGSFVWNGNTCTFVPDRKLEPDTDYAVTIGRELRSLSGAFGLKDRASFGFSIH